MNFKREDLQNLPVGYGSSPGFKVLDDQIIDHTKWSVVHQIIFCYEEKFYSSSYSVGATSSQDESPYEYDEDEIECTQVHPVQRTITVYEPVN